MRTSKILLVSFVLVFFIFSLSYSQPKGAKAIFDSGEGPSVVSPVSKKPVQSESTPAVQKYVGISYQIMLLSADGSFKPVSKARTFRSGERVKLIVRTNRPGYMTIINIGPTGNTHILFNEYVDAFTFHEIPKNTNLVFAGPPGIEKLLIMLSDQPNPIANTPITVQSPPQRNPYPTQEPSTPPPPPTNVAQAPSASDISSMLESAKGIRGAKDIVVEDSMQSKFAVISPKTNYRPVEYGAKDIILESSGGVNYGVIPVSVIQGGGILTLQVNLRHR